MYKVLIVEDEDIIRNGLIYMVDWPKLNSIVVRRAADGIEGLAKIKELQPDIVITDVRMPFQDGIQMLRQSKAEHDYEAIIISGYSELEYARQAISLSVSEYLLKPIDFDKLNAAIVKLTAKIQLKLQRQNERRFFDELHLYNELLDIQAKFFEKNLYQ
ncbi:response regulator [Paenibacillus dendritiformis]|uniref:response regulator n=1 Tax=Paenibacillus dendritiformis TaxID=130049 RepID=UPI001F548FBD|nr:response regulator [Paenibacillus dendritiformis]